MTRLLAPFARITLGDNVWNWGDGFLKKVEVTSAEGEKSSSCRFCLYDPDQRVTDQLFAYVEDIEGLEPLEVPANRSTTGVAGGSGTASGELSANMRAALDLIALGEVGENGGYSTAFGGGTLPSLATHPEPGSDLPAGRYQVQGETYDEFSAELADFGPQAQDTIALRLIDRREATAAIEAGDIQAALEGTGGITGLAWEWAALPPSRYGQSKLTLSEAIAYFEQRVALYQPGVEDKESALESITADKPSESVNRKAALAGSQITIELGFGGEVLIAASFLHISLNFKRYPYPALELGGQASAWVLSQRRKNTAYQNLTLKQIAQKMCDAHGLTLDMAEDGPTYEYFPQRGVSDYEALLIECRRIGYRITNKGNTLTVKPRGEVEAFALVLGENLGLNFTASHAAQGTSSGGARSSDPSQKTTTGQRKVIVDPDTGRQESIKEENTVGAGETPEEFTTGAAVQLLKPRTTGATDEADIVRKSNEHRIKGIVANWDAPTTPELLLIDPDSAIQTEGVSTTLDRTWVVESITHSLSSSGFRSSGVLYSPMRNKYPQPPPQTAASGGSGEVPPLNPNGFIRPSNGVLTSPFGPRAGRQHKGVDLAGAEGDPIFASADGVVLFADNVCPVTPQIGCNGGYGNVVYIDHADGFQTRYAHLNQATVSPGQQVKQGDIIGREGNSGSSRGVHLHFEIRRNGVAENPASYITL